MLSRTLPEAVGRMTIAVLGASAALAATICAGADAPTAAATAAATVRLPEPRKKSAVSIEATLTQRRSVRRYADAPLTLAEAGQLLWAAQGITDPRGFRTAPSAGATYPLELYLAAGNVEELAPGAYRYLPREHALAKVADGDRRDRLCAAALGQAFVRQAPATVIITAVYQRTSGKYGERATRYVDMEAGHVGQNIALQAIALDLGTVMVGAFVDDRIKRIVGAPDPEQVIYMIPVGRPR